MSVKSKLEALEKRIPELVVDGVCVMTPAEWLAEQERRREEHPDLSPLELHRLTRPASDAPQEAIAWWETVERRIIEVECTMAMFADDGA